MDTHMDACARTLPRVHRAYLGVGIPVDVKFVRVGEHGLVAVGRLVERNDALARLDDLQHEQLMRTMRCE